jgi:flagellar basal-body rod modification protein FlgD
MSTNSVSGVSNGSSSTTQTTSSSGASMSLDKNAFLKILSTELANQDPSNSTDSTQYVSQLAQFSSLEQMSNMNAAMRFSGMSALIGKSVVLSSTDSSGNNYSGAVKSVSRSGDTVTVNVAVGKEQDSSGNTVDSIQGFDADDVESVSD